MDSIDGIELKKKTNKRNIKQTEPVINNDKDIEPIKPIEPVEPIEPEDVKPEKVDGRRKPRTEKQMENMKKALETRRAQIEEQKKRVQELKVLEQAITMKKMKQQAKKELKEEQYKNKIEKLKKQLIDVSDDEYYDTHIKKQMPSYNPQPQKQEAPSTVYMTRQQYMRSLGF
jgi:uncharacterized short protein YbdD (DUF466 family)